MEQPLEIKLVLGGLILMLLGGLILVVRGFRQHWLWGVACLIPPFFLLFVLFRFRKALPGVVVILLGFGVGVAPMVINRLLPIDLGPYETQVEGGLGITLTGWDTSEPRGIEGLGRRLSRWLNRSANGWDRRDYSVLRTKTDVVQLYMANPDVTDETLEYLRDLKQLRDLDLSETQITDAGLAVLTQLPRLETLRLKRTAITDAGVSDHLLAMKSLKRLELTDSKVSAQARKEWRLAEPGRVTMPR